MLLGTERQPCRRGGSPLGVSTAFTSTRRALDENIAEFRQPPRGAFLAFAPSRARHQPSQSSDVVGRGREPELPGGVRQPAVAQLAEQAVGLHPAERLLHLFALALAHPVTGVTRRSAVNPPPRAPRRHMRRDSQLAAGRDKRIHIVALIRPHRAMRTPRLAGQQRQRRLPFLATPAFVTAAPTIKPLRFSVSTCRMKLSLASLPLPLRYSRASGYVTEACVALRRLCP